MALGTRDLHATLHALHAIAERCRSVRSLADAAVAHLPSLAAAELTTLSICDLRSGRREVLGGPRGVIPARFMAVFDWHLPLHPLVRHHGRNPHARTHQLTDLVRRAEFRSSASRASTTAPSALTRWWRCLSTWTIACW